jgi:3-deoxy-manno-octulosonate cytidylyltransferase (CMP-KDO synthetase)
VKKKDIAIFIPARLNSKRLPSKLFFKFDKLEMIEVVRRRALLNSHGIPVYVVSGDKKILALIQNYGGKTIETFKKHPNGLSRSIEANEYLNYSKIVLLQGDEVLVDPSNLDLLISKMLEGSFDAINCVTKINYDYEISDQNIVKCISDNNNFITGIFRKSPFVSQYNLQKKSLKKITGLFAFNKINAYNHRMVSKLALKESIEQLFFIENSIKLKSLEIPQNLPSVNTKKDYELCKSIIKSNINQNKIMTKINESFRSSTNFK